MSKKIPIKEYKKRRLGTTIIIILLIALILICWLHSTVLALNGDSEMILQVGDDYLEHGATSIINKEIIIDSSNVDTTETGRYQVTYRIANNTINRTIIVEDTLPPEITLKGNNPIYIIQGDSYIEYGVHAIDNADGDISNKVKIVNNVDTSIQGSYIVKYQISDSSGNTSEVTRIVNVVGAENPTIMLEGFSTEYIEVNTVYNEAGFTAFDKTDNDISDKVVVTGTVDVYILGSYDLTYTVTNNKGNSNAVTRTIIVRDTQKPDIKLNGDSMIIIDKNTEYIEEGATAFDNYDGDLTDKIIISGSVYTNTLGIYFVTYEVTDYSGNKKQIQREIMVKNNTDTSHDNMDNTNEPEKEEPTFVSAEVNSFNKNLQNNNNKITFTVTVTMSDGTVKNIYHEEKIKGDQKGSAIFNYDIYKVYVAWNDNNTVTTCEIR